MPSIGIDVGSTAAKAAVFENGRLAETLVCPTGFSSVDAAERLAQQLLARGFDQRRLPCVATGYGRVAVPYADRVVTEITCHGKGAGFLFGGGGTVVDVGGQDTKVIVLRGETGLVQDIANLILGTKGVKNGRLVVTTTGQHI